MCAARGYVLVPPSNHVSGNSYTWESLTGKVKIAEAPRWLLDIILMSSRPSPP
jgi:hypothetical protein